MVPRHSTSTPKATMKTVHRRNTTRKLKSVLLSNHLSSSKVEEGLGAQYKCN